MINYIFKITYTNLSTNEIKVFCTTDSSNRSEAWKSAIDLLIPNELAHLKSVECIEINGANHAN